MVRSLDQVIDAETGRVSGIGAAIVMRQEGLDQDYVREQALIAALNVGMELPVNNLIGLAKYDPSPMVRMRTLEALANDLEDASQLERLSTIQELAQSDPEAYVKERAERLIEQLNSPPAPPELPAPPDKEADLPDQS